MNDTDKQVLNRAVDATLDVYKKVSVALTEEGYPPEMVIQGALAQAAGDAIKFGYCLDAMQEMLATFYAEAVCGQAKCPHCGVEATSKRS